MGMSIVPSAWLAATMPAAAMLALPIRFRQRESVSHVLFAFTRSIVRTHGV